MTILSSLLAEAKSLPEWLTEMRRIQSECPCVSVKRQNPDIVSQNLIDWSREHESRKSLLGRNDSPDTSCSCPCSVFYTVNVSRFQSLITRSVAHEASTLPLELKSRKVTIPA